MERLEKDKPMLLIGSPMCTAFSAWQRIDNLKCEVAKWKRQAEKDHMAKKKLQHEKKRSYWQYFEVCISKSA